ncbi:DHS-like NAD/FAD-binding domain-containing protein [Cutaneotrichosporon oleaginosum]|uniref:DHS-like NAD/FAD-binding domain-containing protein n=1 Tax=Cutaneotrichosporon oleaginosum TaxID=879819 RepID=A0A0J0XC97_9TREE|nr:DHS-like NAD/FAD-binding domain-containing protein [Cutaneotrichosporon oleaginosum]KLT38703.1 DHS-like NAD/FAD-binding domain-containing protein [Cutaneotrichosporon oleaginosum]
MVRLSIPSIPVRPPRPPSALDLLPLPAAGEHLASFLERGKGRTLAITGAGVSVDSGIRAYRGEEGRYLNPNYSPIFYSELIEDSPRGELFRKRYWGRSFLGYPPVRDAKPNPTHIYIAALQALGLAPGLITQNVDNLHRKALRIVHDAMRRHGVEPSAALRPPLRLGSSMSDPASMPAPTSIGSAVTPILELHGTLARVHCLRHGHEGHEQSRDDWQDQLAARNPIWAAEAAWAAETGNMPRTNPDGDVELPGADYNKFNVPACALCVAEGTEKSIVKPNVIFFGETLPPAVRDKSFELVEAASSLLIMGTTLATYSAFRLIKAAREQGKPVFMISLGPSRADDLDGVQKMERVAGPVLRAFLDDYLTTNSGPKVDAVKSILDAGVVVGLPRKDVVSAGTPSNPGEEVARS